MRRSTAATLWEGKTAPYWRDYWKLPALHILERTGSTNDVARQLAADNARAGTTIIANLQTAGRGRFGRNWDAPAGSALLLSCVARPRPIENAVAGTLPIRVGLAAAAAIEAAASVQVELKWPNDLLIRQRKVGGILCEAASAGDTLSVIIGVGINVHQSENDWPPQLRAAATSLDIAAQQSIDRARLAGELLERLHPLFSAALQPLDASELAAFAQRDALAGRALAVFAGERSGANGPVLMHGRGFGVAADGALLVRTVAGIERVLSGTVRIADNRNEHPAGTP